MKKFLTVVLVLAVAFLAASCAEQQVKRVDSDTVTDYSGRWNDTDMQLTADKMVEEMLGRPFIGRFMKAEGRNPRIMVGEILNNTDEHIDIDSMKKNIERDLTNSDAVVFLASKEERAEVRTEREDMQEYSSEKTKKAFKAEIAADFMLKGVITSITDAKEGARAVYYQIDMEIVNMETNQKPWYGQKKIKKDIKNPKYGF